MLDSCPECKSKKAYHSYLGFCDCGYDRNDATVTRDTPVTIDTSVSKVAVTHVTLPAGVPEGYIVEPSEVCPTCHEKKPSKAALKQREWRQKQ